MFEIKDIAGMEFVQLLQHVDLDELDIVELSTDGQDMQQELLGTISVHVNGTFKYAGDGIPMMVGVKNFIKGWTCPKGPLLFPTPGVYS